MRPLRDEIAQLREIRDDCRWMHEPRVLRRPLSRAMLREAQTRRGPIPQDAPPFDIEAILQFANAAPIRVPRGSYSEGVH
jgi:hypothetical protein